MLETWGYAVSEAENGLDGLALATTDQPNVVVTDVNMPYLNGWEVRRALARNTSTSTILVIVLTSELVWETRVGLVLPKPLDSEGKTALREALANVAAE